MQSQGTYTRSNCRKKQGNDPHKVRTGDTSEGKEGGMNYGRAEWSQKVGFF